MSSFFFFTSPSSSAGYYYGGCYSPYSPSTGFLVFFSSTGLYKEIFSY